MSRYRRVNIDGQSLYKTETRATAAAVLPGTFAVIDEASEQFKQAGEQAGRLYLIESGYHQGLGIRDVIPAGDSAVGNYVEEGRELAVLCGPGHYRKDAPIKLGANGMGALADDDTDGVLGYSQDMVEITPNTTDFIRVRFRVGTAAAATTAP